MNTVFEKTDIVADINELRNDYLANITNWPISSNRICLNNHDGNDDYVKNAGQRLIYSEYKYMNSLFKNTIWERTLEKIPVKIGRARIMLMPPQRLLIMHRDIEVRWHLALFTDPSCVFYDLESKSSISIPADGHFYRFNTRRLHTAFNSSNNFTRIHLVVCEYV